VHHIFLRSRFDILVAHRFDSLLLGLELVPEYLKFDPILSDLLFLLVKCASEFAHLVLDPLLVGLEEANLLRVQLVVLTLLFHSVCSPIENLSLHIEAFDLLLQLVVEVHDLGLLLIKLGLSLPKDAFFGSQIPALIFSVVKLLAQLDLCLIHLLAELRPTSFNLLKLDLKLLGLLNGLLFFFGHHVLDSLLILSRPLDLDFQVDSPVADLSVLLASIDFLLVNVCKYLFLLLLVLMRRLLLPLGKFCLLGQDLTLSLVQL